MRGASRCLTLLLAGGATPVTSLRGASYAAAATSSGEQPGGPRDLPSRPAPAPVSQGIAILLKRERLSRDDLMSELTPLANQLGQDIGTYSVTEVAAFCEVCRKCGCVVPGLADKVLVSMMSPLVPTDTLKPFPPSASRLAALNAEELPSVLWMISRSAAPTLPHRMLVALADVCANHLEEMRHEDFPDVVHAVSALAVQDAFLLTALGESMQRRKAEFTPTELCLLLKALADMKRQYYDTKLWNALGDEVVCRGSSQLSVSQVTQAYACFLAVGHRHAALEALAESALRPLPGSPWSMGL